MIGYFMLDGRFRYALRGIKTTRLFYINISFLFEDYSLNPQRTYHYDERFLKELVNGGHSILYSEEKPESKRGVLSSF